MTPTARAIFALAQAARARDEADAPARITTVAEMFDALNQAVLLAAYVKFVIRYRREPVGNYSYVETGCGLHFRVFFFDPDTGLPDDYDWIDVTTHEASGGGYVVVNDPSAPWHNEKAILCSIDTTDDFWTYEVRLADDDTRVWVADVRLATDPATQNVE